MLLDIYNIIYFLEIYLFKDFFVGGILNFFFFVNRVLK